MPLCPVRRRFACQMATVVLIVSAWRFQSGMHMVGYIMGWPLVAAAIVNVRTGFCVPSFIYRLFMGKVVCE